MGMGMDMGGHPTLCPCRLGSCREQGKRQAKHKDKHKGKDTLHRTAICLRPSTLIRQCCSHGTLVSLLRVHKEGKASSPRFQVKGICRRI